MAWEPTNWACGHSGAMQLIGKHSDRSARVAYEAGRKCMACWLVEQWQANHDPRAQREDRYVLAARIAEAKGKRISVPDSVPVAGASAPEPPPNPLADVPLADLVAEIERRRAATH